MVRVQIRPNPRPESEPRFDPHVRHMECCPRMHEWIELEEFGPAFPITAVYHVVHDDYDVQVVL